MEGINLLYIVFVFLAAVAIISGIIAKNHSHKTP